MLTMSAAGRQAIKAGQASACQLGVLPAQPEQCFERVSGIREFLCCVC